MPRESLGKFECFHQFAWEYGRSSLKFGDKENQFDSFEGGTVKIQNLEYAK